ncbi:Bacteriophage T5 orf 172 domain-containing protein associated with Zinc finger domain [Pacmanvirus A23]|uniref:Bacteriophage T5 orf 172 domain-containing protein associated with Zinc finger domain n=1 Tax=Pacmanvirus A23 TaxID=1932881 RepID=UPI000A09331C|nr:Bacteriophage T5 orf 172 domain-containing protein associated with Zinc finger domain [Pacmanvirus A23]SIP85999.1 Bacteriophage T5 orf 172 domain-containing protein associated with Zinc finger domain [Pacmanvirus A23]
MDNKTCIDCGKICRTPADLLKHRNRKSPCVIKEVSPMDLNNPNRCIYCNKVLSKKEHLTRHQKICKQKEKEPENKADIEIRMLKEQMLQMQIEFREQIQQMQIEFNEQIKQLRKDINNKVIIEKPETTGYLYFITEIPFYNKVKIGISKNPAKRLKQLQTGNPNHLVIYHAMESTNYKLLERTLHSICKDLHVHGEWFEMTDSELQSIISGL